jgi:glycosyltransferase involved in cell wall biosynthesis
MADAVGKLLNDDELRAAMGGRAAAAVAARFSLEGQIDAYLDVYQELRANG